MISASDVKKLRELTGAGMMDCKKALVETDGNVDKAVDLLREKGMAKAAKKSGRIAAEGLITQYIHGGGRIGVLLEVNCETDFVAENKEFQGMCRDIAMQIAATKPEYVKREDVPEDIIQREKDVLRNQAINDGKKEEFVDRIVEGRIDKFYKEICLLEQDFIKDSDTTVKDIVSALSGKIGEKLSVRRFARFEVGEGIEKREDDLASEIEEMTKGCSN